ncbi:hypothetical protein HPP92_021739 [Vanilla planifolia]|uniref:Uncharacterized protein n=1 Tax=Vanilla planifolia TaxID=51239 RepID=A0A835PUE9_VANPL|nr:hypothetical protein HPP92_021739 [Vanilla planifolia]
MATASTSSPSPWAATLSTTSMTAFLIQDYGSFVTVPRSGTEFPADATTEIPLRIAWKAPMAIPSSK